MKRSTRTAALAGAVTGLITGVLVMASMPVSATTTPQQHGPVCGSWHMRGATGAYPGVTFGGAPAGSSVSKSVAKLVKPGSGVQPGVEFAAKNLSISAPAGLTVTVGYVPSADASTAAGAIRLFGYQAKNADTLNTAPDWQAIADSEAGGSLSLTIPAGASVGTLGMVYDASNPQAGSVTFSNLKAGHRKVSFTPCPVKKPVPGSSTSASPSVSTSASASASASASTSATPNQPPSSPVPPVTVSASPSASPSEVAPPVTDDDLTPVGNSGSLPLTGPGGGTGKIFLLIGLGLIMFTAGLALFVIGRRRKAEFAG